LNVLIDATVHRTLNSGGSVLGSDMAKIFISYRRQDTRQVAGRIYDRLADKFGADNVFMDVDAIPFGVNFHTHLNKAVRQANIVLVLIGEKWSNAEDEDQQRRLDLRDDFVRIEIEEALRHKITLIPVLINGAQMPHVTELPESLQALTQLQAATLDAAGNFQANMDRLIRYLELQELSNSPGSGEEQRSPLTVDDPIPAAIATKRARALGQSESNADNERTRGSNSRSKRRDLASLIENFVNEYGEINVLVYTVVSAFCLILISYAAGLHDVIYTPSGKQVGFIWAPNWSLMYLIVFPIFNLLFCMAVGGFRRNLRLFIDNKIITGPGGRKISGELLLNDWQRHMKAVSATLFMLIFVVAAGTFFQWYRDCYLPVKSGSLLGGPIDWSSISIVQPETASATTEIWFSGLAYAYMAFSLWIYLSVMIYPATFSWYLQKISIGDGSFRLIPRQKLFQSQLATLAQRSFIATFLGLFAAYLMRLQASYLQSSSKNIFDFMFLYERKLFNSLFYTTLGSDQFASQRMLITSAFSSWGVAAYALFMFTVNMVLLMSIYYNSKEYYLSHISSPRWRENVQLSYNSGEIEGIKTRTFLDAVLPSYKRYAALVVGMLASCLAPWFGSLVICTLLFAVGGFMIWGRRRTRGLSTPILQNVGEE
jgi:hypothetical protein